MTVSGDHRYKLVKIPIWIDITQVLVLSSFLIFIAQDLKDDRMTALLTDEKKQEMKEKLLQSFRMTVKDINLKIKSVEEWRAKAKSLAALPVIVGSIIELENVSKDECAELTRALADLFNDHVNRELHFKKEKEPEKRVPAELRAINADIRSVAARMSSLMIALDEQYEDIKNAPQQPSEPDL